MNSKEILKSFNLKCTKCREGILNVILSRNHALSENEIRENLSEDFDRTTFYRSFKTLEESHVIHKIVLDNQSIKYAYNDFSEKNYSHIHFFCLDCKSVKCIDLAEFQHFQLPEGFTQKETEILIKGTCSNCVKR